MTTDMNRIIHGHKSIDRCGFTPRGAMDICEITDRLRELYVEQEDYESAAQLRDLHDKFSGIALGYSLWDETAECDAYQVLLVAESALQDEVVVFVLEDDEGLFASFVTRGLVFTFPVTEEEALRLDA